MSFHVGQKVVCIDDSPPEFLWGFEFLSRGKIYIVDRCYPRSTDGVILVALVGMHEQFAPYNGWRASRFRPIVSRKTDIAIFKRMLLPQGVDA